MLSEQRLKEIKARCAAATPGPWYYHNPDDALCMNVVAVTTKADEPDTQQADPEEFCREIVALTLYQRPRVVCHEAELWFEDGLFIAAARQDVPDLVAEVERLRAELAAIHRACEQLPQAPPCECGASDWELITTSAGSGDRCRRCGKVTGY